MKPLVSVCIPAYNSAEYITETIQSILKQSYSNLELIVVDDCSEDDTCAVVEAIPDKRIRLYRNERNLGMSGNWNRCLELCAGEYIKLICADDLLASNALEREVEALIAHPQAVLAESDTRLVDLNGKGKGFYKRYGKHGLVDGRTISRKGFFVKDYFGAPQANTFRRDTALEVGGFDPAYIYILDYDFFVSVANRGMVYIIHEPLNYFRVRRDSNTGAVMGKDPNKTRKYVDEHRHLLEKNKEQLKLSDFEIAISVCIRKLRCFAAAVYLKLLVHR